MYPELMIPVLGIGLCAISICVAVLAGRCGRLEKRIYDLELTVAYHKNQIHVCGTDLFRHDVRILKLEQHMLDEQPLQSN